MNNTTYCNASTQDYYTAWNGQYNRFDDAGNLIPEKNSPQLRDKPPLSNYTEVEWEKKYLDIDLEMYFAESQLNDIKKVLFPRKNENKQSP